MALKSSSCAYGDVSENTSVTKPTLPVVVPKETQTGQGKCGSSSVGRAAAFQAAGRGFEPRLPLKTIYDAWFLWSHFQKKYTSAFIS